MVVVLVARRQLKVRYSSPLDSVSILSRQSDFDILGHKQDGKDRILKSECKGTKKIRVLQIICDLVYIFYKK